MAKFTNQAQLKYDGIVTNSNIATGEILETLSVNYSAQPTTYYENDVITFVVNLNNSGNTALTDLTVIDNLGTTPFAPTGSITPLTYVTNSLMAYSEGASITPSVDVTVSIPKVTFSDITVPANGVTTLIYEVRANGYAPLGSNSTITSNITVSGAALSTPLTQSLTLTCEEAVDLTINKSISPAQVTENQEVTYTFDIANHGLLSTNNGTNDLQLLDTFTPPISGISVTADGSPLTINSAYSYDAVSGVFYTTPGILNVPGATAAQDPTTGIYSITPGHLIVTITGRI